MSQEVIFESDNKNPQALMNEFFSRNNYFSEEEKNRIQKAWEFLCEKSEGVIRPSGEPFYLHPLRVADILASNKLDCDTIISAILHTVSQFNVEPQQIKNLFGDNVYNIINVSNKILNLPIKTKTLRQADSVRKMFFAIADDVRVILITLADRMDRIRNIKGFDKEEQRIIAEEIIDIWAPLADRLGMQNEKNEFEDLSLKYSNPVVFKQIKEIVSQKKDERANYLEKAVNSILKSAEKMHISVTIKSRAKHFYSIYQKMRKRNKEASELYDLLALRILCNSTADCYALLGIVHSLWKPMEGRFKDYIAIPKSNGYQSLHTTVMCEGKPLEIQIRTNEMNDMAEHGIASHWLYKKGTNKDFVEAEKLEIFNKLQKLKETAFTDEQSFSKLKDELLGDEIYVFTPKGDVIKLPSGANAIDFAYAIHSAIGEKIIAAKANGKIIPLTKSLENTQIIEIITNPQAHPTEAQLKAVRTTKAHQRIHSWLAANDASFSENLAAKSENKNDNRIEENSQGIIVQDSVNSHGVSNLKNQKTELKDKSVKTSRTKKRPKDGFNPDAEKKSESRNVVIQGDKNVLYSIALCCKPKYPDLIVGYVTRMRGVTIHRADCLVYQRIPGKEKRNVEVSWGNTKIEENPQEKSH